jgi:hypothetical protein
MSSLKKKRSDRPVVAYRPLMIAALVAGGVMQPLLRPVLAAGVAAGTTISNTATATYSDDNNNPFNATSNTVQIKVAPISGITVKTTGITDVNLGSVEKGDALQYNFDVKNVGNLTEKIFIPATPTIANFTLDPTTPVLINIGTVAAPNFVNPADPANSAFFDVVAGGYIVKNVAPDQVVQVRVVGTVPTTGISAGDPITVTLGNTGSNDNSPATQNVVDGLDGSNTNEVRTASTLDPNGVTGPVDNKEASGSQSIPFAAQSAPQAFSLLKKTVDSVNPGATANGNDDTVNYNLNFSVLNTSPNGSLTPADLAGTKMQLEGLFVDKVLVSDAIPVGTVLSGAPTAVAGWTAVYSTDAVDSTAAIGAAGQSLPAANWTATAPTTPAGFAAVKRVGFIANTATVAKGSTVDFKISVTTSNLPVTGGNVNNIAQAFGQTFGDPSPTPKVVFEESGDANPSNFDDQGNPGPAFDPTKDIGKADPTTQGVDPTGGNIATNSVNGEVTQTKISGTGSSAPDSLLNGPQATPDAVGPTDVNDDFTNQSASVAAGQDPTVVIPVAVVAPTFTNSVKNPGQTALAELTIEPIAPQGAISAESADANATTGQYGTNADIPNGTIVTITATPFATAQNPTPTAVSATYTYDQALGKFVLNAGQTPVNVGTLPPNGTVTYTTDVTLPAGSVKPFSSVAIPVIAFSDESPSNTPGFTGELTNNITIDRVYTGYIKLVKEAQVLSSTKQVIQAWTDTISPNASLPSINSGQYIEYRIRYTNISSPAAAGSGNVVLNANSFKLIEDGAAAGFSNGSANTWFPDTLHQKSTFASNGTVTYYNGTGTTSPIGNVDPADGSNVGRYENNLTVPLTPNDTGYFQFRRLVK